MAAFSSKGPNTVTPELLKVFEELDFVFALYFTFEE
jgi:hypothetical protein